MPTTWEAYLAGPGATGQFAACRRACSAAFDRQRENIRRVFERTAPRAVACLGAGVLNDIPFREFLAAGATIHLVDWLPGSIDAGLSLAIIEPDENGLPRCAYCDPAVPCPESYCRHFQPPPDRASAGVCEHYIPGPGDPPHCAAFERGELPTVHYADVTGGYATEFGRAVGAELGRMRTWKDAFARARTLAGRIRRHRRALDIPDDAVQLVTSSMVVSQFEHEPYDFFARQVAARIGPPSPADESRLRPAMERLRTELLDDQLERHLDEIERILAPGGRCYFATEFFHWHADNDHWVAVEGVPRLLDFLGRRFAFDFDLIPEGETLTRFEVRGGRSLVCSFVLESMKRRRDSVCSP